MIKLLSFQGRRPRRGQQQQQSPSRMQRMEFIVLVLLFTMILMVSSMPTTAAYVPPTIKERWSSPKYTKEVAIQTIEDCALAGSQNSDLFCAVKYMDRFANSRHYPTLNARKELMECAEGSWELRLALNSDQDYDFYPHPEFRAFAMAFITIDENYFGKGIAPNTDYCFVALGGPSTRDIKKRMVFMEYEDYYINGRTVPGWDLSYFMRGYQRNWVSTERKRPPLSFTIIAATSKALVLRGSKTGGIAIFRRVGVVEEQQDTNDDGVDVEYADMRPAAYGY